MRRTRPTLPLLAGLMAVVPLAGCDEPACIYSGQCINGGGSGGVGGLGEVSAAFPAEGTVVAPSDPTLERTFPGTSANGGSIVDGHPQMPIFLQFSESLNPDTVDAAAFNLVDTITQLPVPTLPRLVGDGKVVVVTPLSALADGRTYALEFTEDQEIADLNGQLLTVALGDELIAEWTVDEAAAGDPRVVYAYPNDGETMLSDSSEIVIGFDREMDDTTIDDASFDVVVEGAEPVIDPAPVPLATANFPGAPSITQVWRWIPVDGDDRAVTYGRSSLVEITLSPASSPILSADGDAVPVTESVFDTIGYSSPAAAVKVAGTTPSDAFGRLEVFDPAAEVLFVTFDSLITDGVELEVGLFGTSPTSETDLRSVMRTVQLPVGVADWTLTTADLGFFDEGGDLQFADGAFRITVALVRNGLRTGVRVLDGDGATAALDSVVFDTTPPTLLGLGAEPGTAVVDAFTTSVGDLAIVGRADESVAYAYVETDGGAANNGGSQAEPPALAFGRFDPESGEYLFVTAPVAVGITDPGAPSRGFELFLYDRAYNAVSMGVSGRFGHVGVVGPGGTPVAQPVEVRVLDARTYAPIEGATVYAHQEVGGAVTSIGDTVSDALGLATVTGAASGSTVVTVDAAGYDLLTFHGVPRDRVDVLLEAIGSDPIAAAVSGDLTSTPQAGDFTDTTNVMADSRFPLSKPLQSPSAFSQSSQTQLLEADYGPFGITAERLGLITFLATTENLPKAAFSGLTYLRGFATRGPLVPVAAGAEQMGTDINIGTLLALQGAEAQAVGTSEHALDTSAIAGFGTLAEDPVATLEAAASGVPGPFVVGRGEPYAEGADTWALLGAYGGVASPGGPLATAGAIDADLFFDTLLVDGDGNVSVARPRLSTSGDVLTPLGVPTLLSPPVGGMASGAGFNVVVADRVSDASGLDGLTRVRLEDTAGRGWVNLRLDTDDGSGDLVLSFPDLAAVGGAGLVSGTLTATVETWAGTFDRGEFLYTDLERLHEAYGRAAAVTFTLP